MEPQSMTSGKSVAILILIRLRSGLEQAVDMCLSNKYFIFD